MALNNRLEADSLRRRVDAYEALRERFRPSPIKVLFVGESRPANGTFFYRGDSRLARYTCEAFGPEGGLGLEMPAFLERFYSPGCFLVDLCPVPVNHLSGPERRRLRRTGEPALARILSDTRPSAIIVVMIGIAASVDRAATAAGAERVPRYVLPFPAQGHEREYVRRLRDTIARLREEGVLD